MTTQPENKDKAEQKVSKDELSDKEVEKATGGSLNFAAVKFEYREQKPDGTNG